MADELLAPPFRLSWMQFPFSIVLIAPAVVARLPPTDKAVMRNPSIRPWLVFARLRE